MKKLLEILLNKDNHPRRPVYRPRVTSRTPEPPIGFVRRSDPNFYFLARKF
jgi:hypothetical protein